MQRRLVGVFILGAALANTAPALAQPADPAADKAEKARQARALYEEGNTAYNLANFDEAITKFKAAYALTGAPGLLFNIAQAYRLKKEYEQALYFYRTYLRLKPDAQNRGDVEARIAEMEQMLEEQKKLGGAKPVGTLPPDGNPAGGTPPGGTPPGGTPPGGTPPGGGTAVADGGGTTSGGGNSATIGDDNDDDDTTIAGAWSPQGSTFGMELRADVDTAKFKGAVFAVGVTFAITPSLELAASALLGGEKGANLGGRFLFGKGRLRPLIMLDAPVFFTSEKTLVGVHGAAGLRWDLSATFGLELDLGVSHFFGPPEGVIATYFVPSLSLQGRL